MHILYLHQYFVPPDGSGGTRSFEMARRFVAAGHKVTLITSSAFFPSEYKIGRGVTKLNMEGINLYIINVSYSNKFSYATRIVSFFNFAIRSILQVLIPKNVDVVFATSTPLTIALPGLIGKIYHRCQMVFEVRDLWPELPIAVGALQNPILVWLARRLERLAYENSSYVVALSPGMAEGVVKTGFPCDKVVTIPNSCDVKLFRVKRVLGDSFLDIHPYLKTGPLITYSGTLGIINGVEYLIEIAAEMLTIFPQAKFLIAGDGHDKELVVKRAEELKVLKKNVWFLPPIAKKDMPKLLSASTVATSLFIDLPEMWNNSANKFFDALAAGRPVMINYRGWQAEFIDSSSAGLVVPPGAPAEAARLLRDFLNDPGRLEKARQAAIQASDTIFSRDILADKLRALLEDAANEKQN